MSPNNSLKSPQRTPLSLLEERFIKSGFEGFNDEEIIELLLSLALHRRKCKELAKACIEQFRSLSGLLTASTEELQQVGLTPHCICGIKLFRELPMEVLKQKIIEKPVYKCPEEVFDYLRYSMRDLNKEVFKVLYLNNRNQIINTSGLFEGTLDSIPIRPREIVESAIKHSATRLIFAHNHPAGDPKPSKSDKQITRDLVFMGMILEIKVLDHIIIGGNEYFSFADAGLIQRYEDNFLNLKIKAMFDSARNYTEILPAVLIPLFLMCASIEAAVTFL